MSELTKKVEQAIKLLRLADAEAENHEPIITFDGDNRGGASG